MNWWKRYKNIILVEWNSMPNHYVTYQQKAVKWDYDGVLLADYFDEALF